MANSKIVAITKRFSQARQRKRVVLRAVTGNGAGTVAVEGFENQIWVRPYGRPAPIRAYCAGANLPSDLLVRVEVFGTGAGLYYKVIGTDTMAYGGQAGGSPPTWADVPAHHANHEWSAGGHDVVFVHENQWMPLLLTADGASMVAHVSAGIWWVGNVTKKWFGGDTTDLTPYVPEVGLARYVRIYVDPYTAELGYQVSDTFVDQADLIPEPYTYSFSAPANAIVAGLVLLHGGMTVISPHEVYPTRNVLQATGTYLGPISGMTLLATTLTGLYSSVEGVTWNQLGGEDPYLATGLQDLVAVSDDIWLVFRIQATASADDPLVYRTVNGAATWAKAQSGISFTQGTDLWKVYAVWHDPSDKNCVCICIANTTTAAVPQVFVTVDGGATWTEIDNTGLPSILPTAAVQPVSIAWHYHSSPPQWFVSLALKNGGMYFATHASTWTQEVDARPVYAVLSDVSHDDSWLGVCEAGLMVTNDNWATYAVHYLYNISAPSDECYGMFQHGANPHHLAVGGDDGVHTATGLTNFFLYPAMAVGKLGKILRGVGDASTVVFSTTAGTVYVSNDGCVNSAVALGITDITGIDNVGQNTGGSGTFLALDDTPDTYNDQAYKLVQVHPGTPALRFVSPNIFYMIQSYFFSVAGDLTVGSGPLTICVAQECDAFEVYLHVGTAPAGASIIVDVNKNGVTMFTTQAERPVILAGATTSGHAEPDIRSLTKDDELTFDIDQIGSTTPGANLTIHVRCRQLLQYAAES